ncbi:MAG: flavodoxin family protein [Beduini sp.]|uniref:flavodoxin family protein n=1 Tax=Beduini sp. TaxID=1922300 RepID=UPI0039A12644
MKVIIHDLKNEQFQTLFPNLNKDIHIIFDNGKIKPCIGCFGCWIKTPGTCIIKDGYEHTGAVLSQADKVIIISQCVYGGYSPFIKNIVDRSISYVLPFFNTIDGETHHQPRYQNKYQLSVYFYGKSISSQEKSVAQSLVKSNSINFNSTQYKVSFFDSIHLLAKEVIL